MDCEPIEITQGDDKDIEIELSSESLNAPIDITSWSFASQVRESYESQRIVATATITKPNASGGVLNWNLTNAQTALLNPKITYVFDIEATKPDNKKIKIYSGKIKILPEVTK